jgi:hypothetical protein
MSYAYTPGLKVSRNTLVRKNRMLPVPGEVLVKQGESVTADKIVARTYIPGSINMIPMAFKVGCEEYEVPRAMKFKEGQTVQKGELMAEVKSFFGLFKSEYRAETSGTIELISPLSGMVGLREPPVPVNLTAYFAGRIAQVLPNLGAIVETRGAFVQGIFGIGGEKQGDLMTIASPEEVLTSSHISEKCANKVLVGGALVSADFLKRALEVGVRGIVVGGIDRNELSRFLGYDIGVAITGNENINTTCIVTEGFGRMKMANHTYSLLKSLEGRLASINGATQIRAGVIRPEIVVPLEEAASSIDKESEEEPTMGMELGMTVRIIRQPYFGGIGQITALPAELQRVASGSWVRVLAVKLDDGRQVTVPRANVEIMEQ